MTNYTVRGLHAMVGLGLAVAIILMIAALTKARAESPQTVIRDNRGSTVGTATTSGNVTTFRDARGATTGTATRDSGGQTIFRNERGATTGSASVPSRH